MGVRASDAVTRSSGPNSDESHAVRFPGACRLAPFPSTGVGEIVERVREIVPGIHTWSLFSNERGTAFNGFAVETSDGTVLVDPVDPAEEEWSSLDNLAPYIGVYLTNRNHSRAAAEFRSRYGTPVRIHGADAEQAEVEADETLDGGETVAGEIELVGVPGKSPGELALFVPGKRALIVGDLVIGVPGGALSTYPEEALDDPDELRRSAANLLDLDFEALLLCDGEPFLREGKDALRRFVEQQTAPS
jgi:glyoxylase-like metal-dependent hydrolase (beta-lactamase superfamily II)